jgi:hypothetical protein
MKVMLILLVSIVLSSCVSAHISNDGTLMVYESKYTHLDTDCWYSITNGVGFLDAVTTVDDGDMLCEKVCGYRCRFICADKNGNADMSMFDKTIPGQVEGSDIIYGCRYSIKLTPLFLQQTGNALPDRNK